MSSLSAPLPPASSQDITLADINAVTVALYATGAHRRRSITDDEFQRYVDRGTRLLGSTTVATLARRLHALDSAWARGQLTDEDYNDLRRLLFNDLERLERCYEHALGP